MKVLLGVTGSVAAVKTPKLIHDLSALTGPGNLQVITTKRTFRFWNAEGVAAALADFADPAARMPRIWRDGDEWPTDRYERGQQIPHIDLATWADAFLIAPLTANVLAQLAAGMCHNLLACTARAWHRDRPIIVAPAMNTEMWNHPATAEHLATLRRWYPKFVVVDPVVKMLACGVVGVGGMADAGTILRTLTAAHELTEATPADAMPNWHDPVGERVTADEEAGMMAMLEEHGGC